MDRETRRLIQEVSRETAKAVGGNVAKKVVRDTLLSVGIDAADPIAAQEAAAGLRQIAKHSDSLVQVARVYQDHETVQAIGFARDAHRVYRSGKARAVAGATATLGTLWVTGIWAKIRAAMGL